MRHCSINSLRLDDGALNAIHEQLPAEPETPTGNCRRSRRYPYRARVVMDIVQRDQVIRDTAACRNLSREGVGLLVGRYLHVGTRCTITLVSEFNLAQEVSGTVQHCAYISGTPNIHMVGVKFESPIDIALYQREANLPRVGLLSRSPLQIAVVRGIVADTVELTVLTSTETTLAACLSDPYDMLLLDFDDEQLKGCDLARTLRQKAYARQIACLSTRPTREMHEHCTRTNCDACSPSCCEPDAIHAIVRTIVIEPMVSNLANDPSAERIIDGFVHSMREETHRLETAFASNSLEQLRLLASQLGHQARVCGFELLAENAAAFGALCTEQTPVRARRDGLGQLIRLCQAVRPAVTRHTP